MRRSGFGEWLAKIEFSMKKSLRDLKCPSVVRSSGHMFASMVPKLLGTN
jgi:hypothetical protein